MTLNRLASSAQPPLPQSRKTGRSPQVSASTRPKSRESSCIARLSLTRNSLPGPTVPVFYCSLNSVVADTR